MEPRITSSKGISPRDRLLANLVSLAPVMVCNTVRSFHFPPMQVPLLPRPRCLCLRLGVCWCPLVNGGASMFAPRSIQDRSAHGLVETLSQLSNRCLILWVSAFQRGNHILTHSLPYGALIPTFVNASLHQRHSALVLQPNDYLHDSHQRSRNLMSLIHRCCTMPRPCSCRRYRP